LKRTGRVSIIEAKRNIDVILRLLLLSKAAKRKRSKEIRGKRAGSRGKVGGREGGGMSRKPD